MRPCGEPARHHPSSPRSAAVPSSAQSSRRPTGSSSTRTAPPSTRAPASARTPRRARRAARARGSASSSPRRPAAAARRPRRRPVRRRPTRPGPASRRARRGRVPPIGTPARPTRQPGRHTRQRRGPRRCPPRRFPSPVPSLPGQARSGRASPIEAQRRVGFVDADLGEPEAVTRRRLRQDRHVGGGDGRDLRVAARRPAVRHQHDRHAVPADLHRAECRSVRHDIGSAQVGDRRAGQPAPDTVRLRGQRERLGQEGPDALGGEAGVLRTHHDPDGPCRPEPRHGVARQAAPREAARHRAGSDGHPVSGREGSAPETAEARAREGRSAAEHGGHIDRARHREIHAHARAPSRERHLRAVADRNGLQSGNGRPSRLAPRSAPALKYHLSLPL